MSEDNRKGIIKLNKIRRLYFNVIVEGIPKRVDSNIQATISMNIELKMIKQIV